MYVHIYMYKLISDKYVHTPTHTHTSTHTHTNKLNEQVAQLVVKTSRRKTKSAEKRIRLCFFYFFWIYLYVFLIYIYLYIQMYMNGYSTYSYICTHTYTYIHANTHALSLSLKTWRWVKWNPRGEDWRRRSIVSFFFSFHGYKCICACKCLCTCNCMCSRSGRTRPTVLFLWLGHKCISLMCKCVYSYTLWWRREWDRFWMVLFWKISIQRYRYTYISICIYLLVFMYRSTDDREEVLISSKKTNFLKKNWLASDIHVYK